jgi:CO dehydrogenase/acetyl-CoA synthase beta subunit
VATFDVYVKRVAAHVNELRASGRQIREFECVAEPDRLLEGLPVQVGPGASSGIILRGDTFAELGSPEAGSCAFPLWTNDLSLVKDGRVTLIGPDIQESTGASLPLGQVVIVGGDGLGDEEHAALEQSQYVSDRIEGYMIRSTPGRLWSRVSKEAAGKGFGFEVLGKALLAIFKSEIPKIQSMEVVFVTSDPEDLKPLEDIAEQVRTIGTQIARKTWLARGVDILECTMGWDCKSCSDKTVCDEIREIVKIRKRKVDAAAES